MLVETENLPIELETGEIWTEEEGEGGGLSSDLSSFSMFITRESQSSKDFFLSFLYLGFLACDW